MPHLSWKSKTEPTKVDGNLATEMIVYPAGIGYPGEIPSNKLILGDNYKVMTALLPEFENRIDLIYADPPFFTNRHYPARIGRGEDSRRPEKWQLSEGYRDSWETIDEYLDMLYPRLALMYQLLSPGGTLYLHLDWHANSYARLLLDEIFGAERYLNEIVWVYHGPSPIRTAFNRKHDTILVYTKTGAYTFNVDAVRQPYNPKTVRTFESSPKAGFGKKPDLDRGKVPEDWWYYPVVARLHSERTGYPTQKPAALLERIIRVSSNPGDLVADFFSGSGTTSKVASSLGRKFITSDIAWRAVHTSRVRLVEDASQSFLLQYESESPIDQQTSVIRPDYTGLCSGLAIQRSEQGLEFTLDNRLLDDLDYWEAGWINERGVFCSHVQASRPLRRGCIPEKLILPADSVSHPVQVRLVKVDGSILVIQE